MLGYERPSPQGVPEYDAAVKQWFCVRTKPHAEDFASTNIAGKDILVFNPKIEERYGQSRRIAPLFPSYIFAQFALSEAYYKVVWTPGVKQIVGCGHQPTPVDEAIIHLIWDRLADGAYIRPKLQPGEPVRVTGGVFSEFLGIFEAYSPRSERVKILLELFNQRVEVEIDPIDIEPVSIIGS